MKTSPESKTGLITNNGLKGRKSNQQQSDHLICEVSVAVSHCFIVPGLGSSEIFQKAHLLANCCELYKMSKKFSKAFYKRS